ncbi:MAG: SDR family NAD(P)-dependent oxidoreductase, partial [Actinomycetes bacterium]
MTIAQDLAGKVVVVTGAGRGIGRQIAIGAGSRGAKVALVELIAENLDATVKEISAMGITAKGYKTDVSSESEIIKNFALIEKDFGQIDCLV